MLVAVGVPVSLKAVRHLHERCRYMFHHILCGLEDGTNPVLLGVLVVVILEMRLRLRVQKAHHRQLTSKCSGLLIFMYLLFLRVHSINA